MLQYKGMVLQQKVKVVQHRGAGTDAYMATYVDAGTAAGPGTDTSAGASAGTGTCTRTCTCTDTVQV